MASQNRDSKPPVNTAPSDIEEIGAFIKQYDFYSIMRILESKYQVRFGSTKTPEKDPILFGQTVHLHFAPSNIDKFRSSGNKTWLDIFLFGLSGPNGPLPSHLTERVFKQLKEQRDTTTLDFLNIFHHRLISLYYRAWANKEPIVQYDSSQKDSFRTYIGSLAGYGLPALQNRDSLPDHAKLKFAATLGGKARHTDGLVKLIESIFDIKASILEFTGEWMTIPSQHQCILKESYYAKRLGRSSTLGKLSWQCQSKFKVILEDLDFKTYESFLPTLKSNTKKIEQLNDAIRTYVGLEFTWEITPKLKKHLSPSTRLGQKNQLGWTSWLKSTKLIPYKGDVRHLRLIRLSPPKTCHAPSAEFKQPKSCYKTYATQLKLITFCTPKHGNEFYTASSFTALSCELPTQTVESIHINSQQIH
jgi:type VI secretion system protein ImpH